MKTHASGLLIPAIVILHGSNPCTIFGKVLEVPFIDVPEGIGMSVLPLPYSIVSITLPLPRSCSR